MKSIGKRGLIACAVGAALGSSGAFALGPTVVPDAVLYAAGGSAQANAFTAAANQLLSSPDSYSGSTSACTDDGAYRIWFGATAADITANSTTVPAGTKLLLIYKFNGGSFVNGVVPQVDPGSTLNYPQTSAILSTSVTSQTCTNAGAPKYFYTTGTTNNAQVPDWGVSDLEVNMFQGYNNPPSTSVSASCATNVTTVNCLGGSAPSVAATDGIYDNLFGVAVTHNVYTDTTHPKTNFTRAEMALIISGSVTNWNQLYDDNGAQMAPGPMVYLDRGPGSGTKASASLYFLGYPTSAANLPRSAKTGYTGTGLNATSCLGTAAGLQDVNEGSTTAVVNDLIAAQNAGCRAVAVLGLENPPALHQNGGSTNLYDFTAINGVFVDGHNPPTDDINGTGNTTYKNAASGAYDFYYQNSFNTRTSFLAGTSTGAIIANQIIATMQAAGFVSANASVAFPNAVNGTLQDADKLSLPAKGGTMATRNKQSPTALVPKFKASNATSGVPIGSDPL